MTSLLIVGLGPHTEQNHLPVLLEHRRTGRIKQLVGFDVPAARPRVDRFMARLRVPLPVTYASAVAEDSRELPDVVVHQLDALVRDNRIDSVLVACEPSFHTQYALWALDRGLHLLIDKPMSARLRSSVDSSQAQLLLQDFEVVADAYRRASLKKPGLGAAIMCQRRFHPVYSLVRELVVEVAERTGCPVTSMQSFHSDGQWRLPNELTELSYHSFDRGYGKISHSGYHFIDFMSTVVRASLLDGPPDEVEVFANAVRPLDYLAQLQPESYSRFFEDLPFDAGEVTRSIAPSLAGHGEIDAFLSLRFRRAGRALSLGSVNLVHNGLSLRAAAMPDLSDLYRGSGRVRHESHIIEQGPFQAIHIHSLRSGDEEVEPWSTGGRAHLDVYVFRNNALVPSWQPHARFRPPDLGFDPLDHQGYARAQALEHFLDLVDGRLSVDKLESGLLDHALGCTAFSAAYLSLARRAEGRNPLVTLPIP